MNTSSMCLLLCIWECRQYKIVSIILCIWSCIIQMFQQISCPKTHLTKIKMQTACIIACNKSYLSQVKIASSQWHTELLSSIKRRLVFYSLIRGRWSHKLPQPSMIKWVSILQNSCLLTGIVPWNITYNTLTDLHFIPYFLSLFWPVNLFVKPEYHFKVYAIQICIFPET